MSNFFSGAATLAPTAGLGGPSVCSGCVELGVQDVVVDPKVAAGGPGVDVAGKAASGTLAGSASGPLALVGHAVGASHGKQARGGVALAQPRSPS